MTTNSSLRAIIWDFDGTLVDTRHKNLAVNRQIVQAITDGPWQQFPVLQDVKAYDRAQRQFSNWREFYGAGIGLEESEIDRAGAMWTELQLSDPTPVRFFDGIGDALMRLGEVAVQGIVSQNSRENIFEMLDDAGLAHHFDTVVGYEEVEARRQKPSPDGLLMCIERLAGQTAGTVLFVGDHETDVRCAQNAARVLEERGIPQDVMSVGVSFDGGRSTQPWTVAPDFFASSPGELSSIVDELDRRDRPGAT